MKAEKREVIYRDIEEVFVRLGLRINRDRETDSFFVDFSYPNDDTFVGRFGGYVTENEGCVVVSMGVEQTVPSDKIPVMLELINLINQSAEIDHLYIHPESKRVWLTKGIFIDNAVLDKREFENAIRTILGNGRMFFSLVLEQMSSNEKPQELMERFWENNTHLCRSCDLNR